MLVNLQSLKAEMATLKKSFASLSAAVKEILPTDKFHEQLTVCADFFFNIISLIVITN